jgi:hypothetical protein
MQESYPQEMTKGQAELIGKLRREYFTSEAQMGRRREELRVQGERVEPPVKMTVDELMVRGQAILLQLSVEADSRVRKALREELTSLAYALSSRN